jgi:uracil-DNA glycosylase
MTQPSQELSSLTHALRRHLRRRRVLGDRRGDRWSGERATPVEGTVEAPAEAAPAPAPAPEPAPETGWPQEWGTTPEEKAETDRRCELLTTRAQQCPDLPSLREALADCSACSLCQTRKQTVFMDGRGPARVMFVGEAPGYHEDQQGVPFVGPSGKLLTDIVEKGMGLGRDEVVIANVLKCRPPDNRDPLPAEKRLCTTWLDRQIELVDPRIVIALGRHAAAHLLQNDTSIGRLRGKVWSRGKHKVVATYHPSYLLRSPSEKKACWQDIQLAMTELGLKPR